MNKKLDTNFTYTILAVITVGFLLWNSIAIFNLEQDLKNLRAQDTVVVSASDSDAVSNNNTLDITNTEILYNEDGSIDTSNWKVCEVGALKILCPLDWFVVERGIANVSREKLEKGFPQEDGEIGLFFAGSSDFTSSMQEHLGMTNDYYDTCTEIFRTDLMAYMTCVKEEDDMYIHAFRKVTLEKSKRNPSYYSYADAAASFITKDKQNFDAHEDIVSAIMKELSISPSGEKFIPSK